MTVKLCFPDDFTIICKKCGSKNCTVNKDFYPEMSNSAEIICLSCKENEFLQEEEYKPVVIDSLTSLSDNFYYVGKENKKK